MRAFRLLLLCVFFGLPWAQIEAGSSFLIVGVNSSNKCDDPSLYKTCDGDLYGKIFFSFRPQDSDSSRRILGWFNADYIEPVLKNSYMVTISPQYTRSFDTNGIAQWFFFNGCNKMTVGIPNEYEVFDIDGSQIGLSLGTLYDPETDSVSLTAGKIGTVRAQPLVENFIVDLDFWCDLSAWREKLWLRLEMPVVYMKTNMHMRASGRGSQADAYPLGLFSLQSTTIDDYGDQVCGETPVPYSSILCALEGNQGWGAVEPLKSGKFSARELSKWGVAGLHLDLGYDFYKSEPWYAAGSLHVVFPTGTKPKGTYVLEPVIGANKSWQLGGTVIANYVKEFKHSELGIYFYAVGTHLFRSKQERVFSLLANGPGSQLLLLKQFNAANTELLSAPREANIFCGETKIGSTLMFDGSLMLQYSRKRFVADVGYNYWIRTKERRSNKVFLREFADEIFGIKGSLQMKEISDVGGIYAPLICNYNLTTDSTATIAGDSLEVDDPAIFIQASDVNYGSALAPTSMSNKVFGAIGFKSKWFALLCGEAEFGMNNAAITQWGVMLKLGREF
jgi:hypothetical protein